MGVVRTDLACPLCMMQVVHHTPDSDAYIGMGRDADGCPRYKGTNPLFYEIAVCPYCHFAAYHDDFAGIDPYAGEIIAKGLAADKRALAVDFSQAERSIFAALRSYELALKSYELREAQGDVAGGVALRAAWICRYSGQLSREVAFMIQAIGSYRDAFFGGIRTDRRLDMPIPYLIGELQLRCGQVEEAIGYFERMEATVDPASELGERTAERLAEARRALGAVQLLAGIPIFGPMGEASLGLLAVNSRSREFAQGEPICKLGDPGDAMFVIAKGKAAVYLGAPGSVPPVVVLGPGQSVGEMALLTGAPRNATVLAEGSPAPDAPAAQALEIGLMAFRHLLKVSPEVMDGLAQIVAQRQAENAARSSGGADAGQAQPTLAAVTAQLQERFEVPTTA